MQTRAVCRIAVAREASSLWLSCRLQVRAPKTHQSRRNSVSAARTAAKPNGIHLRRGHLAPAPAGCHTLSEYGEQSIIRRVKRKLKVFLLYLPHRRRPKARSSSFGRALSLPSRQLYCGESFSVTRAMTLAQHASLCDATAQRAKRGMQRLSSPPAWRRGRLPPAW
jgi:hypothetical protein